MTARVPIVLLLLPTLLACGGGERFRRDGFVEFLDGRSRDVISVIEVEMADDQVESAEGLKQRGSLRENRGMLFVFPVEAPRSFWMQDTPLPLDIVYVNDDLRIVSIARDTEPYSEERIPSGAPARFVVEVNAGYCARHGIGEGDLIRTSGRDDVPASWREAS